MRFLLTLVLALTRRLPKVKGALFIGNKMKRAYFLLCKRGDPLIANVSSFKMRLDPKEYVDSEILFMPHLYDYQEIDFMKANLKSGGIFLDIGANIGFYTLIASGIVGGTGRVLAFEADPYNYSKLTDNLSLNSIDNVIALNVGVADKHETLRLGLNTTGNRGGNSFLSNNKEFAEVPCDPLMDLLRTHDIVRVSGAKLDIEGFEFRVLRKFLTVAEKTMYPGFIIIEHHEALVQQSGGNAIELLQKHGYRIHSAVGLNYILVLE